MRLSFDDEESFKEAVGSIHSNNPSSDSDSVHWQEIESSTSSRTPSQERSEDT